jgi:branched-chain amino acid transport system permease protein
VSKFNLSRRTLVWGAINAVVVIGLVVLPLYLPAFPDSQLTQIMIIAIAVMGLNLLTGFTGQVSVGHSAFFGVGAYVTAILGNTLPTLLAIGGGLVAGLFAGILVGLPSLRIQGTPLAIVTLVLGATFPTIIILLTPVTGGAQGLRAPGLDITGTGLAPDQINSYVVLSILALAAAGTVVLGRSRVGRSLRALGDNEIAARVFGVRAGRLRVVIFAASAGVTAVAGALFAVTNGFISSSTSYVTVTGSIEFLAALVIGGRAILIGPLLGAAIAELLPDQIAAQYPQWSALIYGVVLIAIVLVAPKGLTGLSLPARLTSFRRGRPTPSLGPAPHSPQQKGNTT